MKWTDKKYACILSILHWTHLNGLSGEVPSRLSSAKSYSTPLHLHSLHLEWTHSAQPEYEREGRINFWVDVCVWRIRRAFVRWRCRGRFLRAATKFGNPSPTPSFHSIPLAAEMPIDRGPSSWWTDGAAIDRIDTGQRLDFSCESQM